MGNVDRKTLVLATVGFLLMVGAIEWYTLQDVETLKWLTAPVKQWIEGVDYAPSLNQMLAGGFLLGMVLLTWAVSRHLKQKDRKE